MSTVDFRLARRGTLHAMGLRVFYGHVSRTGHLNVEAVKAYRQAMYDAGHKTLCQTCGEPADGTGTIVHCIRCENLTAEELLALVRRQ